jgi:hypothetical protein
MNKVIETMVDNKVVANGDLNYILFTFCKKYMTPSYNNYKNFCGELRQCATEIERKLLGPYEEAMIKKNGDI